MSRTGELWAVAIAASLAASSAVAQTGPTAEANIDVNGSLNIMALIAIPVVALIVLALFEPWSWFGKGRRSRRDKKHDSW